MAKKTIGIRQRILLLLLGFKKKKTKNGIIIVLKSFLLIAGCSGRLLSFLLLEEGKGCGIGCDELIDLPPH